MASLGKGSDYRTEPDLKNEGEAVSESTTSTTTSTSSTSTTTATSTSTPAPATTADTANSLSWGNVYKTVGDVPDEGLAAFALPKADYRGACYMWEVPNGEVIVPGEPYYRLPVTHDMLSAFGFLDTDTLEAVIAVSDCSDWNAYVQGRTSGKWLEMQEKILQQAVPVQSTAPAPTPTGWNWADCTKMMGKFVIQSNSGASDDVQTAVNDANQLIQSQATDCATPINALCPAVSLSFSVNGEDYAGGSGEWIINTPNEIQALAAALGWTTNKTVLKKLYCFYNGNTNPFSPYINLEGNVLSSSMGTYKASNGTTLSASNCTLSFMLQEALNHSIANFAY